MEKVDNICLMCYAPGEGGTDMNASEKTKELINRSGTLNKDVAEHLGCTPAALSNKLRRNTLTAEEFMKIIEFLGYEMKIVNAETSNEIKERKRGIGERLRMMVNGIKYDTYNADAVGHSEPGGDIFYELYKDEKDRYFVAAYMNWENGVNSISPISEGAAKEMMKGLIEA